MALRKFGAQRSVTDMTQKLQHYSLDALTGICHYEALPSCLVVTLTRQPHILVGNNY